MCKWGGDWRFRHASRRRDDVDIVCTTVGCGGGITNGGATGGLGTPYGVETPRADVSTCVGCSWLVRKDVE